jgi:hypothetical protein
VDSRLFDHDRTRYPLRGRHASVACASCHDPRKAWGAKPAFATCGGCHRDAHGGRARLAGKPVDCAACHSVDGFGSSIFTVAQHRSTAYPLEGRHASTRCDACHRALPPGPEGDAWGTSRTLLAPPHGSCEDCHVDPHRGAFRSAAARVRAEACTACHGLEGFRPSRFDVAAHARTRFPLEGAHRATPCQACHAELASRSPGANGSRRDRPLAFTLAKRACADCHRNPHGDQFATRRAGSACETCHGLDAFAPASRFDHGRDTGFELDGAHARTPCAGCHRTERLAGGATRVVYHPTPSRCESCHTDATRGRTAPEGSP